jgi:uncharacterized protein YukE
MPNWQPNWQDVRWNFAASDEAIASLRQMAHSLTEVIGQVASAAARASEEWAGPKRDEFDIQLRSLKDEAHGLADCCEGAASQVVSSSERARQEQRRREEERRRWERERDAGL